MMEPYAYANEQYRINGYLTYELTIPEGAKYFRINNGVENGAYAYKTAITEIRTITNRKNYGNYFKIQNGPVTVTANSSVTLTTWSDSEIRNTGDSVYASYGSSEVESDYDYIYFEAPNSWNGHVYAYFYGGGDLRKDNWQRACYSIWPGEAPTATEYSTTSGQSGTSDIYSYTATNPETMIGTAIYKFRIPKGERRNYSKVIFNDGLSSQSGSNETSPIMYRAGYLYSPSNTNGTKYNDGATVNYSGRDDKLYIVNAANWDDLHVTFYNSNGTQILQNGKGYILQYEGKVNGYECYSIPIPSSAAKFSVNNGRNGSSYTAQTDILPLYASADTSKKDYTTGDLVYTLSGSTLTRTYPVFTQNVSSSSTTTGSPVQVNTVDYDTRGDKLYIRNTAGLNIGKHTNGNTGGKVTFYDGNGNTIGTGSYYMIQTNTESTDTAASNRRAGTGGSAAKEWYSIDIPVDAAEFTLTFDNGGKTTNRYPIYENTNSTSDTGGLWTNGGMYYETTSGYQLRLIYPTYYNTVDYSGTDSFSPDRGDYLYLVVRSLDDWKDMRVTFYDASGTAIANNADPAEASVTPNYIGRLGYNSVSPTDSVSTDNLDAAGYWFKAAIPANAVSFRVTSPERNSKTGDIYELKQNRTYHFRKDYTPGDMQYRISDTLNGGEYNLDLIYPVFTEDSLYRLEDHEDINSSIPYGGDGADASAVSGYTTPAALPSKTAGTNDAPVLYPTNSDNVTYSWNEGGSGPVPDNKLRFDNSSLEWGTVYAHFWGNSGNLNVGSGGFPGNPMMEESNGIWSIDLPIGATGLIFSNGSGDHKSSDINLSTVTDGGKNQKYTPTIKTGSGSSLVWWTPCSPYTNIQYIHFYNSSKTEIAWTNQSGGSHSEGYDPNLHTGQGYNNQNSYGVSIPAIAVYVRCEMHENDSTGYWTDYISLSSFDPRTQGIYATGTNGSTATSDIYMLPDRLKPVKDIQSGSFSQHIVYTTGSQPEEKTAVYQPEDRYGYISSISSLQDYASNLNSTPTTDNFIKITTGISTPYIRFYSDSAGSNEINSGTSTKGVSLKYTSVNGTAVSAQSSPYYVRIPKNARYFTVGDGTNYSTAATLFDGSKKNEFTATLSGTTVTVSSDNTTRTTHSADVQGTLSTDSDYIYVNGLNHAYYYGGADGELCAWPGVEASFSYVDNSGTTIYAFRIPTESGSRTKVYPYVILNSGSNSTTAIAYTGGTVYTTGTAGSAYGTWAAAPTTTTGTAKTSVPDTDEYNSTDYIYIINNGTKNLVSAGLGNYPYSGRYVLDEMHVEFFDENKTALSGTNASPGYLAEKLTSTYAGGYSGDTAGAAGHGTVYRIAVPSGAKYFRINNGQNKEIAGGTYNNKRLSEIKELTVNGLYRFVAVAESDSGYIQDGDTVPTDLQSIGTPRYLLELVNTKPVGDPEDMPDPEGFDVHLATIVTDENGAQKYIKWLKPKPGAEDQVDTEYLDHTSSDINNTSVKEVRVKKTGTYYWVETRAPEGYKVSDEKITFEVTKDKAAAGSIVSEIVDERLNGKVLLTKTAQGKVGNVGIGDAVEGARFKLTTRNDTFTALELAKKKNKSEYYLIPTDPAKKAALIASGEYEMNGDSLKVYTDTLVTDSKGHIKIENLPWGDYVLTEMAAPTGFSIATPGSVSFTISKTTSNETKDVSLKNKMDPSYIRLFEHINEWRHNEWGDPTFNFRIKQTAEYVYSYDQTTGNSSLTLTPIPDYLQTERLVSLTVNDSGTAASTGIAALTGMESWFVESTTEAEYNGMFHIDANGGIRLEPGTYEITRVPVSRYEFVKSAATSAYITGSDPSNQTEQASEKVTVTVQTGHSVDVHYYDRVGYYDKFSQADSDVNMFYELDANKDHTTVKGIRVDNYYKIPISGNQTVNASSLSAYLVYMDGSETAMTAAQMQQLTFTYTGSDTEFRNDFGYAGGTISINNAENYHDSVYTLNASYNGHTDTFDIVFEISGSSVTYYYAPVIFMNDHKYSGNAYPESNVTYFSDGGKHTHAYAYTFVIAFDGTNKTIADIRHNGTSIVTSTPESAWSIPQINVLADYRTATAEHGSYSFDSWVSLNGLSGTTYSDISGCILAQALPANGNELGAITYAARLSYNAPISP